MGAMNPGPERQTDADPLMGLLLDMARERSVDALLRMIVQRLVDRHFDSRSG